MEDRINIGVFGLGTVGGGVVELLRKNEKKIFQRVGKRVQITKAVTANPDKKRDFDTSGIEVSDDPDFILNDPEISIVLELIGGIDTAEEIVLTALKNGKSVVTANKALLAEKSREIFSTAYSSKGDLGFEASVAGGIPIIRNIREGFAAEQIEEISGIINGTANYILTSMAESNAEFSNALKDAQEKGYAEADPTFDIEGVDTAHKLIILMNLAFGGLFEFNSIYTEGITGIEKIDMEIAKQFGYTIKLLGKAVVRDDGYEGRVHPTLVPKERMLSSVRGAFNAVYVKGNFVGPTLSYGAGAGAYPTASAVVSDMVEICRRMQSDSSSLKFPLSCTEDALKVRKLIPIDDIETEYYLRFSVLDNIGVMAMITKILGKNQISIRSMIQKEESTHEDEDVPVVILTHLAKEKNIRQALKEIDQLPFVLHKTKLIRIEHP